jgi:PAS domain S-box-containing protein
MRPEAEMSVRALEQREQELQRRERELEAREAARRESEGALAAQAARVRALCENATTGLVMMDARQHCTYLNPAAERIFGLTLAEVQGRPLHDLVHHTRPDGRPYPMEECPIDRALPTRMQERGEDVFVRPDGTFYPVSFTASPILEGGVPTGTVIEVRDLTDERRAEAARRETEERYRLAVRATKDAIWDWDLRTDALGWNEGVEELFGHRLADIPEAIQWWYAHVHPEDRERVVHGIHEAIDSGQTGWQAEYRFARADGTWAQVTDRGYISHDGAGRPVRMVGSMQDITRARAVQEAQRFLAEASELLAASADYEQTLKTLTRLAVPVLGDWCAIDLVEADGRVRRVEVAHPDPAKEALGRELHERYPPPPDAPTGVPLVLRTGLSERVEHIPEGFLEQNARDPEALRLVLALGLRSYVIAPLKTRERVLGAITLVSSESGRRFSAEDQLLAEELGRRAALALENARLQDALKLQAHVLERMTEGVSLSDEAGVIVYTNPAEDRMFGYAPGELVGKHVSVQNTDPPEESRRRVEEVIRHLQARGAWEGEFSNVRKDGTPFTTRARITALERNGRHYWACVQEDVTEKKRAEAALRESEERFRVFFSLAAVGMAQANPSDGRLLAVNGKLCELLGYSAEELTSMRFPDFTHPEDRARDFASFQRLVAGELPAYHSEKRYVRKDGQVRWVQATASLVRDAAGRAVRSVAVVQDITERREAEEALRQSEARARAAAAQAEAERRLLDAVLEAAPAGIAVCDANGRIVRTNPANERLWGVTPKTDTVDEYGGWKGWWADGSARHGRRVLAQEWGLARALRGEPVPGDVVTIEPFGAPGVRRTMMNSGAAVRDATGQVVGAVVAQTDITELKRAEEEVRRLNEELEARVQARTEELLEANRELESFSYSVSHDLRAPLRHITGFAELLERRLGAAADEKARGYLRTISDSAQKGGQLVDDLLAFSRLGRAELKRAPVPLGALVEELRRELAPEQEGRAVHWRVGPLPVVLADASLLRSALKNLLQNALKYSRPRAEAIVEVGAREVEAGEAGTGGPAGGEVELFVRDNGVGFEMQYVDKLFGVFQRLHTEAQFEGSGIGLANVRRIVLKHGGRVWAEGAPDAGATFHLTLPRAPGAALVGRF